MKRLLGLLFVGILLFGCAGSEEATVEPLPSVDYNVLEEGEEFIEDSFNFSYKNRGQLTTYLTNMLDSGKSIDCKFYADPNFEEPRFLLKRKGDMTKFSFFTIISMANSETKQVYNYPGHKVQDCDWFVVEQNEDLSRLTDDLMINYDQFMDRITFNSDHLIEGKIVCVEPSFSKDEFVPIGKICDKAVAESIIS